MNFQASRKTALNEAVALPVADQRVLANVKLHDVKSRGVLATRVKLTPALAALRAGGQRKTRGPFALDFETIPKIVKGAWKNIWAPLDFETIPKIVKGAWKETWKPLDFETAPKIGKAMWKDFWKPLDFETTPKIAKGAYQGLKMFIEWAEKHPLKALLIGGYMTLMVVGLFVPGLQVLAWPAAVGWFASVGVNILTGLDILGNNGRKFAGFANLWASVVIALKLVQATIDPVMGISLLMGSLGFMSERIMSDPVFREREKRDRRF